MAVLADAATTATVSTSQPHIERRRSGKIEKKRTIRNGSAALAARWITFRVGSTAAVR